MKPPDPAAPTTAPDETGALIFAWEPARHRRRIPRRLLILLAISAVGHVGSFYGLQVLNTTPAALPPVPAQITLLSANSLENKALARWLKVADPALAISAANDFGGSKGALADLPPPLRYSPSFLADADGFGAGRGATAGSNPLLDELDSAVARAAAAKLPTVTAQGPGLPGQRAHLSPGESRQPPAAKSAIQLSDSLRRRLLASAPFSPSSLASPAAVAASGTIPSLGNILQPTVLLVYLGPEGGAPVIFLQNSAGQVNADEAAREAVAQLFVTVPPGEPTWGEATVFWGRDAYR